MIADGLFVHMTRVTDPFETNVQLPNITCPECTLQIVEFMAEHGVNKDGGYSTTTAPIWRSPPIPLSPCPPVGPL